MLEVKVFLWGAGNAGTVVGTLHIQQVAQGDGSLRDYSVEGWWQPMLTRGRVVYQGGKVEGHDRSEPVWELIRKACEAVKR
jgi:hypothetical protein